MNLFQDTLSSRIAGRDAHIGVIGMGYVGLPLMLAAIGQRFRVTGFDIDPGRVAELNAGESPLRHIGHDVMGAARAGGLFEATDDFDRLRETDIVVICVPTPLGRHREPDLSYIRATAEDIARRLRPGQLVILESTSYPGTTAEVLQPVLERSGLRAGADYFLAFSPEREDPGNGRFSTATIPKVVGADDPGSLALAQTFYGAFIAQTVPVSSTRTAEAVKVTENVFRAVNIALVNELKTIYTRMGIDIFEVIDAAKTKPFGYMPFYPGPGLGGHCVPIDPFYLTWKAREFNINTRFIELAGEINTDMPHYVVGRVGEILDGKRGRSLSQARILVVGVAYKRGVDDIRESPAMTIIELLQMRGAATDYFDPFVATIPRTRRHPNMTGLRSINFERETLKNYDLALIITDHSEIDWAMLVDVVPLIVDTRNVAPKSPATKDKIFGA